MRTDWPRLMRVAIGGLRMRPRDFWDLTPVELMVLTGLAGGPRPLGREGLEALMAAFPDQPGGEGGDRQDG